MENNKKKNRIGFSLNGKRMKKWLVHEI